MSVRNSTGWCCGIDLVEDLGECMRLFGKESRLFVPGILLLRSSACNEEFEDDDEGSDGLVGFEFENLLVVFLGSCRSKAFEWDLKKEKGATL
jgi:hypothetical protein